MFYVGIAKKNEEKKQAVDLAANIFQKNNYQSKKIFTKDNPHLKKNNIVIIKSINNEVIGTAFLIERFFPRDGIKIKGTFISSICIHKKWRNNGLSTLLINKCCDLAYKNQSSIAIVIARRAVDYFYNKFGFWGISNYNVIILKNNLKNTFSDLTKLNVETSHLMICSKLYKKTYKNLFGHCNRNIKTWQHILKKIYYQKLNLHLYKNVNKFFGYTLIDDEEAIHEMAFSKPSNGKKIIEYILSNKNKKELILNLPSNHPILNIELQYDITLTSRQCSYGGHMVKPLDLRKLCQETEKQKLNFLKKNNQISFYKETSPIKVVKSQADLQKILRVSMFNYPNDVSNIDNMVPFNIPLLDQS